MIGAPGTGKTFIAGHLRRLLAADMVQTDAIRKELFARPAYTSQESAAVYAEAHRRIEVSLAQGRDTIFDATNLQEHGREALYDIAGRLRARLHLVWIWAPVRTVARRLARRQKSRDPGDLSDATWPIYRRLVATAEPPGRGFVVLNATLPAAEIGDVFRRISCLSESELAQNVIS